MGDNGAVTYASPGVLLSVTTSDPLYGGNDIISVGAGNDEIFGGVGSDTITAGNGHANLLGDEGSLTY